MNTYLQSPKWSIIFLSAYTVIMTVAYLNSPAVQSSGMALLIIRYVPAVIAIITLLLYFLLRLIALRFGWVVILLGIALQTLVVLNAYLNV